MAAVTGRLEQTVRMLGDEPTESQLAGLGSLNTFPPLAHAHAGLTRMVWVRQLLANFLAQRRYSIVRKEKGEKAGELVFKLDRPMTKEEVPWMTATDDHAEFSLWGEAGKMACPTWDLPAGGVTVGGACPGADLGQTVVDPRQRVLRAAQKNGKLYVPNAVPGFKEHVELREAETICEGCYAMEGQYPSPHVQCGEVIRYWWLRSMLDARRDDEVVSTIVASMRLLKYPMAPQGIMPVRIHSAGDFFSQRYADVWIEVANRVWRLDPRIVMWAPTRTWAAPGWGAYWQRALEKLESQKHGRPNLVVRASAYHFNDPAPGKLHARNAMGSTSLFAKSSGMPTANRDDVAVGHSSDPRADWHCQVYALEGLKDANGKRIGLTCANARDPDGNLGCRACWTKTEMRVQYTAH